MIYVCPTRDIECGGRPELWCAECPRRKDIPAATAIASKGGDTAVPYYVRDYHNGTGTSYVVERKGEHWIADCTHRDHAERVRDALNNALADRDARLSALSAEVGQSVAVPLDALRWLMGMGNDGFVWPNCDRERFGWRSEFLRRADIDLDDIAAAPSRKEDGQ